MSELSGKRILVTGGAGFIGSHLVDILMEDDCFVRVIDNLSNGKKENINHHFSESNFEFIHGDILNKADLKKAINKINIVFNLACLGVRHSIKYPFENHRLNAEGTLNLLELAHQSGIEKFIHCSSSEVYGTAKNIPMKEDHITYPHTVYGASKLAGEAYARSYFETYGLNTIIVRPFNAFGPRSHFEGDAGEMIPKTIVRAILGKNILVFGDGLQTRDFTYVTDTARGLIETAKCNDLIGKTVNISNGFEISMKKIAETIKYKISNQSVKIKYLDSRPGDVLRLYGDSSLLKKLTYWEIMVPFDQGLLMTIDWFRSKKGNSKKLFEREIGINW